jgi:hypothetical protein
LVDDIVSGDIGSGLEVEVEKTLKTLWAMVDYYIWSETKFQDWVHEKRDAQVAFFTAILTLSRMSVSLSHPSLSPLHFLLVSFHFVFFSVRPRLGAEIYLLLN